MKTNFEWLPDERMAAIKAFPLTVDTRFLGDLSGSFTVRRLDEVFGIRTSFNTSLLARFAVDIVTEYRLSIRTVLAWFSRARLPLHRYRSVGVDAVFCPTEWSVRQEIVFDQGQCYYVTLEDTNMNAVWIGCGCAKI